MLPKLIHHNIITILISVYYIRPLLIFRQNLLPSYATPLSMRVATSKLDKLKSILSDGTATREVH